MDDSTSKRLASLLYIDPEHRTSQDINELTQLMLHTQLFEPNTDQEVTLAAVEACARNMKLKHAKAGNIMHNSGDEITEICFIVQGQVKVSVPYTAVISSSSRRRSSVVLKELIHSAFPKALLEKALAQYHANRDIPQDFEVTTLGPGFSYGDLDLIHNFHRLYTAVVTQDVCLAYISKTEFSRTLHRVRDRLFHDKLAFLSSLTHFKQLTGKGLYKLAHSFHFKAFRKHEVVYSEGDPSDSVFIIVSGEFEFSKTLRPSAEPLSTLRRSVKRRRTLRLFIRSPKEFFGQEDLYENRNRFATCTCISGNGVVYYIDKSDYAVQVMQTKAEETLRSQHGQMEDFQNNLLEKSANFEGHLRATKTEDYSGLPAINTPTSTYNSKSPPGRKLTTSRTGESLFLINEKLRSRRTLRKPVNSTEHSAMGSESPLKQSATESHIRPFQSARGSLLKMRPEETSKLQISISEARKKLVKTTLRPPKHQPSLARLKERAYLKMKLEFIGRDSGIKQMLLKQWEG